MIGKTAAHIRIGRKGEDAAARFLKRRGFEILGRNLHFHHAEVDILARDGGFFVFIEVKTLRYRPDRAQHPGIHYRPVQQKRQLRAAAEYMNTIENPKYPLRHDLVEVFMGRRFPVEIRHHIDFYRFRHRQ